MNEISLGDLLEAELRFQRGQPLTEKHEQALASHRRWLADQAFKAAQAAERAENGL